jgi:hypothetical protein
MKYQKAYHSGRAVQGMKFLRPLKHWDDEFESHSSHDGCLSAFLLFVLSRVGSGLATGLLTCPRSPTNYV